MSKMDGVKAAFQEVLRDVGTELKAMGAHGSHELAAALFNGNAFVMYPRGSKDDHMQEHQQAHQQEMSRGM